MLVTGSARGDGHHRGHARGAGGAGSLARTHRDTVRDPLDHLGEVARRVVGRQECKARAGRGAQALHRAPEPDAGVGVHPDRHRVAGTMASSCWPGCSRAPTSTARLATMPAVGARITASSSSSLASRTAASALATRAFAAVSWAWASVTWLAAEAACFRATSSAATALSWAHWAWSSCWAEITRAAARLVYRARSAVALRSVAPAGATVAPAPEAAERPAASW